MDNYVVADEPTAPPVSIDDAKRWLRVENTADDIIIGALVGAATEWTERYLNRQLVRRTYEGYFECLEASQFEIYPLVQIRRAPFVTLTSVEIDEGSGLTAVSASDYQLKESGGFPVLLFTDTPQPDRTAAAYPIKITFTVGYANNQAVPATIKTALLQYIAFLYENRGDTQAIGKVGMPLEMRTALNKYRIINTFG